MAKIRTKPFRLKCGKHILDLTSRTYIMGILNRTPDSFSDGGKFMDEKEAIEHAKNMVKEGADIIDIGGESTRPGSAGISVEEELDRVIPIIQKLSGEISVPISIDTSKHEVAEEALRCGATIINDITGFKSDPEMACVTSRYKAGCILMHIKGRPKDMQINPTYTDLIYEIISSLRESIEIAVDGGVEEDRIVVDPGIGFGKTVEHNLIILNRLSEFKILDKPLLVGTSRKSFIGAVLHKDVDARLTGSIATYTIAIANGANILRVHDVKEAKEVAQMTDAIIKEQNTKFVDKD